MFTEVELDFIKQAASKTKNQGELAVAKWIIDLNGHWYGPWNWSEEKLNIIQYCADECKRQRSGEMSVYDLVNAWNYASETYNRIKKIQNTYVPDEEMKDWFPPKNEWKPPIISLNWIAEIGTIIEPHDNKKGFRTIPIGVTDGHGGWIEKAPADTITDKLNRLLEAYYEDNLFPRDYGTHSLSVTSEDEFYYEFEEIHPFVDGNGRTGKVLYNYLTGNLNKPIMPPNFWGGSNP